MAREDVSPLIIEETTGTPTNTLILKERALPYRPITFEGKQRAEFTWYPGNPVATVQMLGTEESSTTISGFWKDRFIKPTDPEGEVANNPNALWNGKQIQDVRALVDAVEQFRVRGQILQVTWDTVKRKGILVRFKQTWHRHEDVEWELEFQWVSRDARPAQPLVRPIVYKTDEVHQGVEEHLNTLKEAVEPTFSVVEKFITSVNASIAEIEAATDELDSIVQQTADLLLTPLEGALRTLAAIESIKAGASEIVGTVAGTPARAVRAATDIKDLTVGDVMEAVSYTAALSNTAKELRHYAAEAADSLKDMVDMNDLLAVFYARENMDLREVAQQYYGTQEEWRRLRKYNGFRSSRLGKGDLVLVPKITTLDSGS